jgi:hypothetical protein
MSLVSFKFTQIPFTNCLLDFGFYLLSFAKAIDLALSSCLFQNVVFMRCCKEYVIFDILYRFMEHFASDFDLFLVEHKHVCYTSTS